MILAFEMTFSLWVLSGCYAAFGLLALIAWATAWLVGRYLRRQMAKPITPELSPLRACPTCGFEAFRVCGISLWHGIDAQGNRASGSESFADCTACGSRLVSADGGAWLPAGSNWPPVDDVIAGPPPPRLKINPPTRSAILILDDSADRFRAFRAALDPELQIVWWRDAHQMIRDLPRYLPFASVVSLDHDLYPQPGAPDPGDGLLVARHLATLPPACPVIVHSSNSEQAALMRSELELAGWSCSTVMPFGDRWTHEWAMLTIELMRAGDVCEREQQPTT